MGRKTQVESRREAFLKKVIKFSYHYTERKHKDTVKIG